MTKTIFISLPVTDLPASTAFYKALVHAAAVPAGRHERGAR